MKTYPLKRNDGQIFAFEIPASGLWTGSLARLLRRAPGVTNVRRVWGDMDRLSLEVNGELFLVWEPWGDNSRYWVGPADTSLVLGNAAALEIYVRQAPVWFEWPWRISAGGWLPERHQVAGPTRIAMVLAATILGCLLWMTYVLFLR